MSFRELQQPTLPNPSQTSGGFRELSATPPPTATQTSPTTTEYKGFFSNPYKADPNFNADISTPMGTLKLAGEAGKAIVNTPFSLARPFENLFLGIPSQVVGLASDVAGGRGSVWNKVAEASKNFNMGLGETVNSTISGIGKSVWNFGKLAVTDPKEAVYQAAQEVHRLAIEDPTVLPMMLYSLGQSLDKHGVKSLGGLKTKDLIHSIGEPIATPISAGGVALKKSFAEWGRQIVEQAWTDNLKPTPSQRQSEILFNKDTAKFLADQNTPLPGKVRQAGKLVTDTTNSQEYLYPKYQETAQQFKEVIKGSDAVMDWNQYKTDAIQNYARYNSRLPALDYQKGLKLLNKSLDAEAARFTEKIPVEGGEHFNLPEGFKAPKNFKVSAKDFENMKEAYGGSVNWQDPNAKIQSAVNNTIYQTGKNTIEAAIPDVKIKKMNSLLGDYQQALDMLAKRNGVTVGSGVLGRTVATGAGTMVGGIAGSALGPAGTVGGAVIGGWTAEKLAEFMANHNFKTGMAERLVSTLQTTSEGQQLVMQASQILKERTAAEFTNQKLPLGGEQQLNMLDKTGAGQSTYRAPEPPQQRMTFPQGYEQGTLGTPPDPTGAGNYDYHPPQQAIPLGPGNPNPTKALTNPSRLPEQKSVDKLVYESTTQWGQEAGGKEAIKNLRGQPLTEEIVARAIGDVGGKFKLIWGIPGVEDYLKTMLAGQTFKSLKALESAIRKLVES